MDVDSLIDLVSREKVVHFDDIEPENFNARENLQTLVDKTVAAGKLVRIRFVVPGPAYKMRQLLFPAYTDILCGCKRKGEVRD